ncbi:hypothetical protein ACSBR2_041518 [Camellia fascicularis]
MPNGSLEKFIHNNKSKETNDDLEWKIMHKQREHCIHVALGTIGYIAPEVFSRNFGRVLHKDDVYSYGMLVLEMVHGRENIGESVEHTSDLYFPHSNYKKLECDGDIGLHGIESEEDEKVARKMILVGPCCI